jgi:uncharacterized membrane protein YkoI
MTARASGRSVLFGALVATTAVAGGSDPPKISRANAEKIALDRVSGGRVVEGELEREMGRTVWSFDIAKAGTKDVTEVLIDAENGSVVSIKTETAAAESREKAAESTSRKPKT